MGRTVVVDATTPILDVEVGEGESMAQLRERMYWTTLVNANGIVLVCSVDRPESLLALKALHDKLLEVFSLDIKHGQVVVLFSILFRKLRRRRSQFRG